MRMRSLRFRLLAEVLHNSIDPQRLAVACSDIGRYVEQHPVGKRYIYFQSIVTDQKVEMSIDLA